MGQQLFGHVSHFKHSYTVELQQLVNKSLTEKQLVTTLLINSSSHFSDKNAKFLWFQLLIYEDLLPYSVLNYNKIFGSFLTCHGLNNKMTNQNINQQINC